MKLSISPINSETNCIGHFTVKTHASDPLALVAFIASVTPRQKMSDQCMTNACNPCARAVQKARVVQALLAASLLSGRRPTLVAIATLLNRPPFAPCPLGHPRAPKEAALTIIFPPLPAPGRPGPALPGKPPLMGEALIFHDTTCALSRRGGAGGIAATPFWFAEALPMLQALLQTP